MIDLGRIVGFEWDDGNSRKNFDKHRVDQPEAEQVFLDSRLLMLKDEEHSIHEERFFAYGRTITGRQLVVCFTLRQQATLVRVISARDMSRREKERYGQEA